jgi:rod shape-determining protein MreD
MKLTKKQRTIKYLLYAAVILAFHLLQNAVLTGGGALRCFFLVPVCVMLGLGEDEKTAALLGLFGGILWDSVSSQLRGFHAIALMLICFLASASVVFILRNSFWLGVVEAAVGVLIYTVAYWLLALLTKSRVGASEVLASVYLPSALLTAAVTPLIALLLRPLKNKYSGKPSIKEEPED